MYKKTNRFDHDTNAIIANEGSYIIRIMDNAFIPFDPANTDYQEYLEWVSEGNTPEAADE